MSRFRILLIVVLIAAFAGGGWWLAQTMTPHTHQLVKQTTPEGEVYYTCPMHPHVRQPEPGNCPICGMKLLKKEASGGAVSTAGREVLYWYDPMQPEQHFDAPGKSAFMDMELVPKYADEEGGNTVNIDPRMVQNLGIRTARVERGTFLRRVDTVGAVEVDERRIVAVESRAAGWVERLNLRAVGDPVRRGQIVAGVYAPELYAAQEELALAANAGDPVLVSASRRRLAFLGLPEAQIEAVLKTRQAQRHGLVLAPSDGVVTELNVREGSQIIPGTALLRIADLARVWIIVEIPEAQSAWVAEGVDAEVRIAAQPDKAFSGSVEYIYPRLDVQTRTLRARIALDNPDLVFKPGMYAGVTLFGGPRAGTLLVPTEAVIRTGERSVVILAEGEGRFRPATVKVGDDREGQTEILSGLEEGEDIVVSGQFLIDSEANLRGALARMQGDPPAGRMRQLGVDGPPVYGGHESQPASGDVP
jgi:Cu(I)/Ag(I) efflux system membrane fusion protein